MKNALFLFIAFFACSSFTPPVEPVKELFAWDITLDYPANVCASRAIGAQLQSELDAIYNQVGGSIAITEIVAYSWESVGGVPLCACRGSSTVYIINNWLASKNLPWTISNNFPSCVHTNNVGLGNYLDFQKVTIHIEAFL
jgi:hypothetical protein